MTTLARQKVRPYSEQGLNEMPVIAADIIYEGAAVSDKVVTNAATGYAQPLVAGEPFVGFAYEDVDNSGGVAGAKKVKLRTEGFVELPISAAAITDEGRPVYASDDDTFTFTSGSNTLIGHVHRWVSTGIVLVKFKARSGSAASVAKLTDNSSGTASDTIASISDTATKNAIASLAAKVNHLLAREGR